MNKRTLGFSPVLIIIIIVAVAILGFVGWRVYEAYKPTTQNATNQGSGSTTTQTQAQKTQLPATKTYKSSNGYSFEYPATWTVSSEMQGSYETITLKAPGTVTTNQLMGDYTTDKGAVVVISVENDCVGPRSCYAKRVYSGQLKPATATNKSVFSLSDGTQADRFTINWDSQQVLYTAFVKNGKDFTPYISTEGDELTSPYLQDFNNVLNSIKL